MGLFGCSYMQVLAYYAATSEQLAVFEETGGAVVECEKVTDWAGICSTICGDGKVAGAEGCDDGNVEDGDGCSAACAVEAGFSCTDATCESLSSESLCMEVCGDGIVLGNETCDYGNTDSDDGCSGTCNAECGYVCTGGGAGSCSSTCGDGLVAGGEECDDGNMLDADGCSVSCVVETGYMCSMLSCVTSVCTWLT